MKTGTKKDKVLSVGSQTLIPEISKLMMQHQITDVLVMDESVTPAKFLGLVTDHDIALQVGIGDVTQMKALDLVRQPVATISTQEDFLSIVNLMNRSGQSRIPVSDDEGNIVAIVSAPDLLDIVVKSFFEVTHEEPERTLIVQNHQHQH